MLIIVWQRTYETRHGEVSMLGCYTPWSDPLEQSAVRTQPRDLYNEY